MQNSFTLPDVPENCAIVKMGRELRATNLTTAKEICAAGYVKRMRNRIKVATRNFGPQELPYFRETLWRSSRLSACMSPPIPKTKGLLTTRKLSNSAYSHLIEDGMLAHSCNESNSLDQRPCAACAMMFWKISYPIKRKAPIPGSNESTVILCAVGSTVVGKIPKEEPKKKPGWSRAKWKIENDPRVSLQHS